MSVAPVQGEMATVRGRCEAAAQLQRNEMEQEPTRRAAAIDARGRGTGYQGRIEERQERDQKAQANENRRPAGGQHGHVQLGAGLAIGFVVVVRRDGRPGRFGDGVLLRVLALVLHFV